MIPGSAHQVETIQDAGEGLGLNVKERLDALLAEQRLDSRRETEVVDGKWICGLAIGDVQGTLLTLCTV